jgi:riboflavin synthase
MMFTGIVEEVGTVVRIENLADAARLVVRGPLVTSDATPGASIAVNGVCLTVTDLRAAAGTFAADLMAETLRRSSLGHVDGVATLVARTPGEHWDAVRFEIPRQLARFVVEKGSIAVDGVSLTVTAVSPATEEAAWFEVGLIPTTLDLTTLGSAPVGRGVNIEVDVVAKYVARIAAFAAADGAR